MSVKHTALGPQSSLRNLVSTKFSKAKTSQDLIFSDTQLTTLRSHDDVTYQLRYCPTLTKKPTDNKPRPEASDDNASTTTKKSKFNPFETPSEALLVTALPQGDSPTHNLVLNKFPVIPNHVILATRQNKPQTDLLEQDDLGVTYDLIKNWHDNGNDDNSSQSLFAFFNSGEHSGASQRHRHLQFLPVEDMKSNDNSDSDWSVLTDTMSTPYGDQTKDSWQISPDHTLLYNPNIPFMHFAIKIDPTSTTPSLLHQHYKTLLLASIFFSSPSSSSSIENPSEILITTSPTTNQTAISYNLALTKDRIAICPRRNETAIIQHHQKQTKTSTTEPTENEREQEEKISINGTILAGTLMVKSITAWETLQREPGRSLDEILLQIGYPNPNRDRDQSQTSLLSQQYRL